MCKQVTHEARTETTSRKYRTDNLPLGDQNHFLHFKTIGEFRDVIDVLLPSKDTTILLTYSMEQSPS